MLLKSNKSGLGTSHHVRAFTKLYPLRISKVQPPKKGGVNLRYEMGIQNPRMLVTEANVYGSPRKTCRSSSRSNSGGDCGLLPEHLKVLYLVYTYLHLAGNSFMILGLMLDGSSSFQ